MIKSTWMPDFFRPRTQPYLNRSGLMLALAVSGLLYNCTSNPRETTQSAAIQVQGDPDNGGIELPENFEALVLADNVGPARHLVVRDNGDVFVALREVTDGGSIVALRDTTGDGRADQVARFGDIPGTGIAIRNNYLYFAPDSAVMRFRFSGDALAPESTFETIAHGLTSQRQHAAKSISFDNNGNLYVNIGAPSNACQNPDRTPGTPGQDPCPILEYAGGIWRFSADKTNQTQQDGQRYATGIRNAVAIGWNSSASSLYALQHGRDQLANFWPKLYTEEDNAELPAEEFFKVNEGSDFGWPYCYYDPQQNKKLLNPEYGGNRQQTGRCENVEQPIMAFPAHWAPNDLLFYTGDLFPERYKNGAFIAFHGSWNRAPKPQQGYKVVFVPFNGDKPSGEYEVFAEGFSGLETIESPGDARYRPMGLAQGPDGSLYISDSQKGRIWRVVYNGGAVAATAAPGNLARTR
jgi:glucose/arabinose dehydrogenase